MIASEPARSASLARMVNRSASSHYPKRSTSLGLPDSTWSRSQIGRTHRFAGSWDYGKFKYEADQRAKESRKKSSNLTVKEMKYRPKIGPGDFDTKTRKVEKFLGEGHKVKVTIMFRGREMQHPELGRKILENVADEVDHVGKVEFHPRQDGRNMVMVLAPDKQAQARHEKERRKAEAAANAATVEAVAPAADEEE